MPLPLLHTHNFRYWLLCTYACTPYLLTRFNTPSARSLVRPAALRRRRGSRTGGSRRPHSPAGLRPAPPAAGRGDHAPNAGAPPALAARPAGYGPQRRDRVRRRGGRRRARAHAAQEARPQLVVHGRPADRRRCCRRQGARAASPGLQQPQLADLQRRPEPQCSAVVGRRCPVYSRRRRARQLGGRDAALHALWRVLPPGPRVARARRGGQHLGARVEPPGAGRRRPPLGPRRTPARARRRLSGPGRRQRRRRRG